MPVVAAPVTLTFEGVGDLNPVGDFYKANGIAFSSTAYGARSFKAGGSGRFENEPSPTTALFFNGLSGYLNSVDGLTSELSFYYSSNVAVEDGVAVYDGLNGTGRLLATFDLSAQASTPSCPGAVPEPFCNWSLARVTFGDTARSVVFSGFAGPNGTFYDNITLTTDAVVTPVSAPGTVPLVLAALGGAAAVSRRRRKL